MLSNAYFLAKFRFDKAENEPAKKFAKFANFADPNPLTLTGGAPARPRAGRGAPRLRRGGGGALRVGRDGGHPRRERQPLRPAQLRPPPHLHLEEFGGSSQNKVLLLRLLPFFSLCPRLTGFGLTGTHTTLISASLPVE